MIYTIQAYPTYLFLKCKKDGTLLDTYQHGWISKVFNLLKAYSFDPKYKKYSVSYKYYYYDYDNSGYIIPRQLLNEVEEELKNNHIKYEIQYHEGNVGSDINIHMKSNWVDRPEHKAALEFLTNTSLPMRCCSMQTGLGKTYCAIKAITILNKRSLIIVESVSLIEQWINNFLEKTDINESDITCLQGASSISRLVTNPTITPKIIMASLDTLKYYIQRKTFPYTEIIPYSEFIQKYQIGIKVIDECHKEFNGVTYVDLNSSVKHNLYLSATPRRSGGDKRVYKHIFPDSIIGGRNEYNRYVNFTFVSYILDKIRNGSIINKYGYNHIKYEHALLASYKYKNFITDVLYPIIISYFSKKYKPGYKCLIFCSTKAFCLTLQQYISFKFPEYTTLTYLAEDPLSNIQEADIIISTFKSCGTAVDIKGLVTVINTVATKADVTVEQVFGRLRQRDDVELDFVDTYNKRVNKHVDYKKERSYVYKTISKQYNEIDL